MLNNYLIFSYLHGLQSGRIFVLTLVGLNLYSCYSCVHPFIFPLFMCGGADIYIVWLHVPCFNQFPIVSPS